MRGVLTACLGFLPALVIAHGGGLNAEGCHSNRRTGDYHCHGAANTRATSAAHQHSLQSAGTAADRHDTQRLTTPPSGPPLTCHVGPRGGTYTVTRSGRKNYSGC